VVTLTTSTYSVTMDFGGTGSVRPGFGVSASGGFLGPIFNTNGGGNSTIQYDSKAVRKALNLGGPLVQGVREF
jgi:hypothetical protein